MVLGTRERFRYGLCQDCGVAWLMNPPADIGKYYDKYYSLEKSSPQLAKRVIRMLRNGLFGQLLGAVGKEVRSRLYNYGFRSISKNDLSAYECSYDLGFPLNVCSMFGMGLNTKSKILDYGSGNGEFVSEMSRLGFCDIIGMDPFLKNEIVFSTGGKVVPESQFSVADWSKAFDVITMHHVFEHIDNPFGVAKTAADCLKKEGTLLLRFPNIASPHFQEYRGNWWGIHAPRRYFLHSRRSLEIVFAEVGMEIVYTKCDSEYDHYLYSQEYELDIPDNSPHSFRSGSAGVFTRNEIRYWKQKAKKLNRALVGDSIVYYLRHR